MRLDYHYLYLMYYKVLFTLTDLTIWLLAKYANLRVESIAGRTKLNFWMMSIALHRHLLDFYIKICCTAVSLGRSMRDGDATGTRRRRDGDGQNINIVRYM